MKQDTPIPNSLLINLLGISSNSANTLLRDKTQLTVEILLLCRAHKVKADDIEYLYCEISNDPALYSMFMGMHLVQSDQPC